MRHAANVVVILTVMTAGPPVLADKNEESPRLGDAHHPLTTVCGWLDPRHPLEPADDDQPASMSDEEFRRWRDEARDQVALQEFAFASALEWMYGLAGCRP